MWIDFIFQITLMALLGLCLWAAVTDYLVYRIPNIISALMIALYPVAVLTSPFHIEWYFGIFTGVSVLVIGFFLYAAKLFGAGDVKMMAALSLWAGPYLMMPFLVATAISGGALVVLIILREVFKNSENADSWMDRIKISSVSRVAVPYGVAIAIGAGVIVWQYSAEGILVAQVISLTGN